MTKPDGSKKNYLEHFKESVTLPQVSYLSGVNRESGGLLLTDQFVGLDYFLVDETVFGGHLNLYSLMKERITKCTCPFFTHIVSGDLFIYDVRNIMMILIADRLNYSDSTLEI